MSISYEPIAAPGFANMLQELQLPLDAVGWAPQWFALGRERAAQARTVVLLPGFGAGEGSMLPMATYLKGLGHDVRMWGLGRNSGNVGELLSALPSRLRALGGGAAGGLSLIGWSLGGYLAREIARDHPDLVERVITLGSPVVGGPRYTALADVFRARGRDLDLVENAVACRYANPLGVPVTAIYSKRDGIVAWQACIDHWSPSVRHVEVAETHLGLGLSPRVFAIVADALNAV